MLVSRLAAAAAFIFAATVPGQRELLDDLPAERDVVHNRLVTIGPGVTPVDLPGHGSPRGLALCGERLWFARGRRLYQLAALGKAPTRDVAAPAGLKALCTDGLFLYGLVDGAVVKLDPNVGKEVERVPIETVDGERGPFVFFATATGELQLWTSLRMQRLDVDRGAILGLGQLPEGFRSRHWVVPDGDGWYCGSRRGIRRLEELPQPIDHGAVLRPGRVVGRRPARSLEYSVAAVRASFAAPWGGKLLIALERSDKGHVGELMAGVLKPEALRPVERLSLGIYSQGAGKGCKWLVGPKPLYRLNGVKKELFRIAQDPSAMIVMPDGKRGLMGLVLEPHAGVTNADLIATWDAAVAAGFGEVTCPPVEAWVRRERQRKK